LLSDPFFGTLVMHLEMVEDSSEETMYTDSVVIGYNPEYVETLTLEETSAILCHEVMHIVMKHFARKEGRDHEKWNVACDYAINYLISEKTTHSLPTNVLLDYKYANMEAEKIYRLLPKSLSKKTKKEGMRGEVRQYKPQKGKGSNGESDGDKKGSSGNAYSNSVQDQSIRWGQRIAQAVVTAKRCGKGSMGMVLEMEDRLTPKLPWNVILASFLTEKCKDDFTWSAPNRRYLHMGIYLPSLQIPTLGKIMVMVDTSGSINRDELNQFASELGAILFSYPGTKLSVMYIDYNLTNVEEVDINDIKFHPKGGGGTDFRPGFKYIEKEGIVPSCILYFTDGECSSFSDDPGIPTIWIVSGKSNFKPPFGMVVTI